MDAGRNCSRKHRPDLLSALKDATQCRLLRDICTDILLDEAPHIVFQTKRLAIIFGDKSNFSKSWRKVVYKHFFHATSLLVWFGHKKLFMAGGVTFEMYVKKMQHKYKITLQAITATPADHKNMIFKYEG
jgi:hypothetical protein